MMSNKLWRDIRLGIKNLLLHKLRSLLTTLGVVCGVASVVAMLSVGEGASQEVLEQIRKLGSDNIIIRSTKPAEQESSGAMRMPLIVYGLLYDDQMRIKTTMPAVARVVPIKSLRKDGHLGDVTVELRLVGTTAEWFDLVQRPLIAGRVLNARDLATKGNAVVLTEFGARKLLATQSTIGQTVKIGVDYYEVVGIVKSETSRGGGFEAPDQEVDAYIPINVAIERYGDINVRRTAGSMEREMVELHEMIVQARSVDDVLPLSQGISTMLGRFHKKADYVIEVPLKQLQQREAAKRTFNFVLGMIAGISLIVGGIGIMNIMLASVTERTREIGIRRAIGAKRRQIIVQFLIETMVLSTLGGLLGIIIGAGTPWVITYFAQMPTVLTAWSMILSVGISVLTGVAFGIYPAFRAAQLDPIVALRHE